jgi:hypothetical protein
MATKDTGKNVTQEEDVVRRMLANYNGTDSPAIPVPPVNAILKKNDTQATPPQPSQSQWYESVKTPDLSGLLSAYDEDMARRKAELGRRESKFASAGTALSEIANLFGDLAKAKSGAKVDLRKPEGEKFKERTQLLMDQYNALKNERAKVAVDIADRDYKNQLAAEKGRLAAAQYQRQAQKQNYDIDLGERKFAELTRKSRAEEENKNKAHGLAVEKFNANEKHRDKVLKQGDARISILRDKANGNGDKLDYNKVAGMAYADPDFMSSFKDVLDGNYKPTGRKIGFPSDTKVLAEMYQKYLDDSEKQKEATPKKKRFVKVVEGKTDIDMSAINDKWGNYIVK